MELRFLLLVLVLLAPLLPGTTGDQQHAHLPAAAAGGNTTTAPSRDPLRIGASIDDLILTRPHHRNVLFLLLATFEWLIVLQLCVHPAPAPAAVRLRQPRRRRRQAMMHPLLLLHSLAVPTVTCLPSHLRLTMNPCPRHHRRISSPIRRSAPSLPMPSPCPQYCCYCSSRRRTRYRSI